ncbi:hypothetical protein R1X32_49190 [Rhodococcus opacus]|uniref:hypothetical protein n=1 Tax=Rhodococcus opacus TaxID=37919 RepID=UPI0034D2BFE8
MVLLLGYLLRPIDLVLEFISDPRLRGRRGDRRDRVAVGDLSSWTGEDRKALVWNARRADGGTEPGRNPIAVNHGRGDEQPLEAGAASRHDDADRRKGEDEPG